MLAYIYVSFFEVRKYLQIIFTKQWTKILIHRNCLMLAIIFN